MVTLSYITTFGSIWLPEIIHGNFKLYDYPRYIIRAHARARVFEGARARVLYTTFA